MLTINGRPLDLPGDALYITHVYGGLDTLDFDMAPQHELYPDIAEEVPVVCGGNRYLIKSINERRSVSTVHCELDLDALRARCHYQVLSEDKTLQEVLAACMPEGWTVHGAQQSTVRRTMELEGCTDYDIVMQAMETFGVCSRCETEARGLTVIIPEDIPPSRAD